jgi:hypothetical protein
MAELDAALVAICGDSGSGSFDLADVRGPGSVFLVARDTETGGGLRVSRTVAVDAAGEPQSAGVLWAQWV